CRLHAPAAPARSPAGPTPKRRRYAAKRIRSSVHLHPKVRQPDRQHQARQEVRLKYGNEKRVNAHPDWLTPARNAVAGTGLKHCDAELLADLDRSIGIATRENGAALLAVTDHLFQFLALGCADEGREIRGPHQLGIGHAQAVGVGVREGVEVEPIDADAITA